MAFNVKESVSQFFANSRRVFVISKKPDWNEFRTMALVTGIGIIVIAAIGFAIYLIFAFLPV